MKRFVTYLYEYQSGNKSKNIGFIRVNIRGQKVDMQISIRNCMRDNEVGEIYALIYKNELLGVELGEVKIMNGQCDRSVVFEAENIMDTGYSVNEIVGIAIRLQGGDYFASCWQDEFAKEIARGEFFVEEKLPDRTQEPDESQNDRRAEESSAELSEEFTYEKSALAAAEEYQEQQDRTWENQQVNSREVTYSQIDLSQIRDLPSPNWHLATNSFLVHGFWNYGYLVLKKEMEADKEKLSLGVPGIFEKPEAVMAILFGFPEFQEIPSEGEMNSDRSRSYTEKNQEPKVGTFGCWFVELKN